MRPAGPRGDDRMPRWVGQDQEEMTGTKMDPAGPEGDDGHQDGSRRTKQSLRVQRWVGQDQERMMGAKMSQAELIGVRMGLSRPGADDWSRDGSSRTKQPWWAPRQVLWGPVVPTRGEMGPVCCLPRHPGMGNRPQGATGSSQRDPQRPPSTHLRREVHPACPPRSPALRAGTLLAPGRSSLRSPTCHVLRVPAQLSARGFSQPWR